VTGTGDRTNGRDSDTDAPPPEPQGDARRSTSPPGATPAGDAADQAHDRRRVAPAGNTTDGRRDGETVGPPGDTHLILVRHGHARAVELGVVAGHQGCAGLSATGRRQAEALRDRLAAVGTRADVMVTSVLPRAIETAATIAPAVGVATGAIPQDCDLCERHPGEGDGLTWDELVARYGALDPVRDPDRPMSPGGESGRTFRRRARDRVQRLADEHKGRTVVVVTHGGVILAVTLGLLGLGPRSFAHELANTSVTEWVRTTDGRWLLHRFNDAAHLEAVRSDDAAVDTAVGHEAPAQVSAHAPARRGRA
jgi:probable phosphoglycerate mutase